MLGLVRGGAPALAAAVIALSAMFGIDAARADCTPTAANNVGADCTGDTTNQQLGAPGTSLGTQGYGGSSITNATVTVAPGASVTGTNSGLRFNSGTVFNYGIITGTTADGIQSTTTLTLTNAGIVNGAAGSAVHASTITMTNSGVISGGAGVTANISAAVTNSGTITGTIHSGVTSAGTVNLTNTGTIVGTPAGVVAGTVATVVNSGAITGTTNGINAASAAITNSGTIAGTGNAGVITATSVNLTNTGTISGGVIGVSAGSTGNVTTGGTIIGSGGTAIQFNRNGTAASDTLTVLAGARFGGAVDFGGGADTLNLAAGSYAIDLINFNTALSTVNAGGNPYFVTANRIVVADMSGTGAMNRAVLDITGWISSVLPETSAVEAAPDGAASAYAAIEAAAPRIDDAFASFPADARGYAPVLKATNVSYADGSNVWAKGFGGRREQQAHDGVAGSTVTGYGGAFGYERRLMPGFKLGGFLGASANKMTLDANTGGNDTDAVFAGLYGQLAPNATFLDASLIGGQLDNAATRVIAAGLVNETASGSYKGWFVNPALALGHRLAIGNGLTLTPALKARYVAARFDGYTETGSSSNLSFGGRTVQAFEERAELTLAKVSRIGGGRVTTRITGGVLGQQRSGGSSVNVALLGQNFTATTAGQNGVNGYYGGGGIDWQIGRVALFGSFEATATGDATRTYGGQGGVRVAW